MFLLLSVDILINTNILFMHIRCVAAKQFQETIPNDDLSRDIGAEEVGPQVPNYWEIRWW